jgi:hypothetical protein
MKHLFEISKKVHKEDLENISCKLKEITVTVPTAIRLLGKIKMGSWLESGS